MCAAATALAVPVASAAQTPTQDAVKGSGTTTGGFFGQFEFDARSGPSGENPSGQVSVSGGIQLSGPVTCLAVTGNLAVFNAQTSLGVVTFQVTDGPPPQPDRILGLASGLAEGRPAGDCSPPQTGLSETVGSGDIVVVDAQPLPTSKDQCENGGWQTYGGFKNQGDCVSFVASGGKNPPGS
jgi:hypothetical protein